MKLIFPAIITLLLTACGGGSASTPVTTTVKEVSSSASLKVYNMAKIDSESTLASVELVAIPAGENSQSIITSELYGEAQNGQVSLQKAEQAMVLELRNTNSQQTLASVMASFEANGHYHVFLVGDQKAQDLRIKVHKKAPSEATEPNKIQVQFGNFMSSETTSVSINDRQVFNQIQADVLSSPQTFETASQINVEWNVSETLAQVKRCEFTSDYTTRDMLAVIDPLGKCRVLLP
ncbi:hypothetical protein [Vibrio sp. SCSIO 43136]|uniref:hypothetical protein n=1 Tax=Vibrio sp. SCSIO 43136 TaxID=2819101 RepID=UPI002074FF84|nr:hypothetical protein [Vibrio sp. SCSIO 43136]USD67046.1 hypothetical protein J4N39_20635 [Vibrio sp. SCSIO 43136]